MTEAARIFLVEDEALLAMALAEDLVDAGYKIVGPVGRIEKAMTMAREAHIDLALLDANLHGKSVYPVADILIERGVPFAFLTGYATRDIPERFLNCVCLQKPIEISIMLKQLKTLTPGAAKAR